MEPREGGDRTGWRTEPGRPGCQSLTGQILSVRCGPGLGSGVRGEQDRWGCVLGADGLVRRDKLQHRSSHCWQTGGRFIPDGYSFTHSLLMGDFLRATPEGRLFFSGLRSES